MPSTKVLRDSLTEGRGLLRATSEVKWFKILTVSPFVKISVNVSFSFV